MINFFIKNKKIILDCFTYLPHVHEYAKIDHGIKYVPEWWRETPPQLKERDLLTIKKCPAFLNFFKKGVVIPSWFELELSIAGAGDDSYTWRWEASSDFVDSSQSHDGIQFERFAGNNGGNFKLTSPWLFKTKENIDFVWTQPSWNMRENLSNITLLPAVINFKEQHGTNINYFLENNENKKTCKIDSLTPLVILHPLTEREIEIKNHLVTKEEFERIRIGVNYFIFNRNSDDIMLKSKKRSNILKKVQELKG
jgi:hypothetical protein